MKLMGATIQVSSNIVKDMLDPVDTSTIKDSILIVEDNPTDLELLSTILKQNFTIYTATDGSSGFEMALKHKPTCIISDIRMPYMSGFTFLKKIRAEVELSKTPLVLLSALDDVPNRVQGYDLLADLYLTKPIDINEVSAAIQGVITINKKRKAQLQAQDAHETYGKGVTEHDQLFLSKLLSVLHDNISNMDFKASDLAKASFVSQRQLERRLKSLENITPKEYIRQVRLEHAKKLIESGVPSSISDLANRVGFKDPKHFSKIYRDFYGVSIRIKA